MNTIDSQIKDYCNRCAILTKIIKEEKEHNNQKKISTNKVKTIWNIFKTNTGKIQATDKITEINLETRNIKDPNEVAYAFNKFFLSILEN
jgi:hypothetical protein